MTSSEIKRGKMFDVEIKAYQTMITDKFSAKSTDK